MKIGLLTYHSAYNFGSVLQAYATQEIITSLGHEIDIINYRMDSQKNYYSLFPKNLGKNMFIKYLLTLPIMRKRISRQKKYEDVINNIFHLSDEFNDPNKANDYANSYDVYISGSDQLWNKNSLELAHVNWRKYMSPYLLEFTNRKKISYASSISKMPDNDLMCIKNALDKFSHISMREASSAVRLEKIIGKPIEHVLDPTLLINSNRWNLLVNEWQNNYVDSKYIFYYALDGIKNINKNLYFLSEISRKNKLRLVTISPLSPSLIPGTINVADACIYDFLGLIKNAELIITDSYHGALFSINYGKNFYSLQQYPGRNMRIEDVGIHLGFEDRIIYDLNSISLFDSVDYIRINKLLEENIYKSLNYLQKAILE